MTPADLLCIALLLFIGLCVVDPDLARKVTGAALAKGLADVLDRLLDELW